MSDDWLMPSGSPVHFSNDVFFTIGLCTYGHALAEIVNPHSIQQQRRRPATSTTSEVTASLPPSPPLWALNALTNTRPNENIHSVATEYIGRVDSTWPPSSINSRCSAVDDYRFIIATAELKLCHLLNNSAVAIIEKIAGSSATAVTSE